VSDAKRVLVTGASGFIGRHSLPFLVERGFEVHAVARGALPARDGVIAHHCDLLDAHAAAALVESVRPSHLLHFAWYAVPGKFWTAPENRDWAAATLALIRAFAAAGGRRAVCAGSCAEYDWSHATLSEATTPLAPSTLYGTAKNETRAGLESAAAALGLGWAWGRIFWLYGPHEAPGRLVSDVVTGLLAGRRVPVSAGTQQRDFLHVEDVACAFAALTDGDGTGAVNIGSGAPVAVRTVVETIGALIGRGDLIDFGAVPMRAGEPACLVADPTRQRAMIDATPRYNLRNGLQQTIESYRAAP
jgi:nucleoside-diphosphate-sugar epimerase